MNNILLRIEFEVDIRWLKYGALILVGLGFCWLVLTILQAVIAKANDVVVTVQHSAPILQLFIAVVLLAAMSMLAYRFIRAGWNEWQKQRAGGVA